MTNANERYDDREEIKARIRWIDEALKQLNAKTQRPRETKH